MAQTPIDRSELNRALARALAYHETGEADKADNYARQVVRMLRDAGVLKTQTLASKIAGKG